MASFRLAVLVCTVLICATDSAAVLDKTHSMNLSLVNRALKASKLTAIPDESGTSRFHESLGDSESVPAYPGFQTWQTRSPFQHCGYQGMCRCTSEIADCSKNYGALTFIPILPAGITMLNFSCNNVTSITDDNFFLNITGLVALDLSYNGLSYANVAAFSVLKKLKYLSLSYNTLDYPNLSFVFSVPSLHRLDIIGGKLGPVPSDFFAGSPLPHLRSLILYFNEFGHLNMSVFTPLGRLDHLGVGYCEIEHVTPAYLPSLERLILHSNRLFDVPKTCNATKGSHFPRLDRLYLDNNYIESFTYVEVCLPKLRYLVLSRNRFHYISSGTFGKEGLPQLETLLIQHNSNKIKVIDGKAFSNPSLRLLSLLGNKLNFSDDAAVHPDVFWGCPALYDIRLSQNIFTGVSDVKFHRLFGHLPSLRTLILMLTEMLEITTDTFRGMVGIEILYLSQNSLLEIPDRAFDHFTNLSILKLQNNRLSRIEEGTFSESTRSRLTSLDISENPFQCSCDIMWFRNWLRTQPGLFPEANNGYRCSNLGGVSITSYDLNEQACLLNHEVYVFMTVSLTLLLLFLSLLVLVYRYRWNLRLLLYETSAGRTDRRRHYLMGDHFVYDLFVSYAAEDQDWVTEILVPELEGRMGLRLCLHHRDFIPGEPILHSIACSVEASKKMMMLFSSSFAQSEWCQFELSLCLRYAMDHDDLPLVVCLQELSSRDVTAAMLAVIKTTVYIQWEDEEDARISFWDRLSIALVEIMNSWTV